MIRKYFFAFLLTMPLLMQTMAQQPVFTRQDSLRGSVTPEREWWDLDYYHLSLKVDPADSSFSGTNLIEYRVLETGRRMQIDMQPPMRILKVMQNGVEQEVEQDGNAWFVSLSELQKKGERKSVVVEFGGKPKVSRRPPWDGGVAWKSDENGRPFIATAVQGAGASTFWPCKDHPYDEPDSMLISVTFPAELMNVSNGRLRKMTENGDGTKTTDWFVSSPINSYGVNLNIGNYVHFGEVFDGEKGPLDCDYWVLDYNLDKAKAHFKQVPMMLEAFEYWFGPYPFYKDGYKLVEVPYPGMEHQSSVTYGNGFENGYTGRDISYSGWGKKFDFIIIHESGHEWFANNITNYDEADMWIHESFTNYSENLFVEYFWGKEAGSEYIRGSRIGINNDRPVVGIPGVNYPGSGDMYPKGANMLHTIRQLVDDDEKWRHILRDMNSDFHLQTVKTEQIEKYLIEKTGIDLQPVFDQYLRGTMIPTLEYAAVDGVLYYRWGNCVDGFNMSVKVELNSDLMWLRPSQRWKRLSFEGKFKSLVIDKDFYVAGFRLADFD